MCHQCKHTTPGKRAAKHKALKSKMSKGSYAKKSKSSDDSFFRSMDKSMALSNRYMYKK